jgi:hypothetical protein
MVRSRENLHDEAEEVKHNYTEQESYEGGNESPNNASY